MKNTSIQEANTRFSLERKEIRDEYQSQVAILQAELSAKVRKLQHERDRKLLDVAKRQDEFNDNFHQWKLEQRMAAIAAGQDGNTQQNTDK